MTKIKYKIHNAETEEFFIMEEDSNKYNVIHDKATIEATNRGWVRWWVERKKYEAKL